MKRIGQHRPQTTQNFEKNRRKHWKTGLRPSSESNTNKTMNWFNGRPSIYEQNKLLPPYDNLVLSESPCNTHSKNKSMLTKKTNNKFISNEKSYKLMKNKMIENMKKEKLNPNLLNDGWKTFYWSPDLSFCAFATDQQIRKTAQLWRMNRKINSGQRMDYILHNNKEQRKMLQNIALIPQITQELGG